MKIFKGYFKDYRVFVIAFFLLVLVVLTSCEGFVKISGTVTDKSTQKPLPGASVTCYNAARLAVPVTYDTINKTYDKYHIITDSLGRFESNLDLSEWCLVLLNLNSELKKRVIRPEVLENRAW